MAKKDKLPRLLGVVALALFAVGIMYLMRQVAADEKEWSRMVYLFGGVEAIAFAAAGYFFGKEVNRERADNAEKTAEKATEKAEDAVANEAAADTRFASLTALIQEKKGSRTRAPRVIQMLTQFARDKDADSKLPELNAFIQDRGEEFGAATRDTDWEELAAFAEALAHHSRVVRMRV